MDAWLYDRAKEMRRAPALYERRLWKLLRDRRLEGLKVRRQVVIGRYISDFVCLRHRLIVEADGPTHDASLHDIKRDAFLREQVSGSCAFPTPTSRTGGTRRSRPSSPPSHEARAEAESDTFPINGSSGSAFEINGRV